MLGLQPKYHLRAFSRCFVRAGDSAILSEDFEGLFASRLSFFNYCIPLKEMQAITLHIGKIGVRN